VVVYFKDGISPQEKVSHRGTYFLKISHIIGIWYLCLGKNIKLGGDRISPLVIGLQNIKK
jgi:hypothetical protein